MIDREKKKIEKIIQEIEVNLSLLRDICNTNKIQVQVVKRERRGRPRIKPGRAPEKPAEKSKRRTIDACAVVGNGFLEKP